MTENLTFLVLGLGPGAILAAFGLSLAVFYRSSGVVNFATGAIGMYAAYTYNGLRSAGSLFNPIFGLPALVKLSGPMPAWLALLITAVISGVLGLLCYADRLPAAAARPGAGQGRGLGRRAACARGRGRPAARHRPGQRRADLPQRRARLLGGLHVPDNGLWAAGLAVVLLLVAMAIYNFTRFGVVTRAVVESEKGSVIVGVSPERVALANWGLGALIAGLAGAFISPLVAVTPSGFTLLVVPALAVALVGGFSNLPVIVISGLVLGMLQSNLSYQAAQSWYPPWLGTGAQDLLPLIVVLVVLLVRGSALPTRGMLTVQDLPQARQPHHVGIKAAIWFAVGLVCPLRARRELPGRADDLVHPGDHRAVVRRRHRLRRDRSPSSSTAWSARRRCCWRR